jgi:predicted RNase H-like nuclease (RuvC/YqgF family)
MRALPTTSKVRQGFIWTRWRCGTISKARENNGPQAAAKRTYTIVGIDPGTTTAFAVLDLKGKLINIASSRSWGFSELVGLLIELGHPIIIATDKNPTPGTVDRIKRAFNAILHTPASSLSVEQKLRDTKSYSYANEHERDALAAAIDAVRSVKNKLESVEKKAPPEVVLDELQMLVLRGHTVDSAINLLKKPLAKVDSKVGGKQEGIPASEKDMLGPDIHYLKALIKRQDEQINRLVSYVVDLKRSLQLSQEKVLKLQNKIDIVRSENARNVKLNKEISFRQKEIDRLAAELAHSKRVNKGLQKRSQKLKQIRAAEHNKALKAIKIVKFFNREAIQAADEQVGLAESIILLEDASGGGIATAELLVSKGIRAIVLKNEMSDAARKILFSANVPIFSTQEVPIQLSGNLIAIDKNTLEIMIEKGRAEIANVKQQERLDRLETLVEGYKHDRMKSSQDND